MKVVWTLKRKLLILFLSLSLLPLSITSYILYTNSIHAIEKINESNLSNVETAVRHYFDQKATEALSLAEGNEAMPDIIAAVKHKDKDALAKLSDSIFEILQHETGVSVFEFGDEKGVVIYRAHNPSKAGDDKSTNESIQAALKGEQVKGFEFGSSGLAVRGFVPVKDGGTVVGTLQVGFNFDEQLLKDLEVYAAGSIALYQEDILLQSSEIIDHEKYGQNHEDPAVFQRVSTGVQVGITDAQGNLHLYEPLYNPTGTQVQGMIRIDQDLSELNQMKKSALLTAIAAIAITLVIVLTIAVLLTRGLMQPIYSLIGYMKQVANGELNTAIPSMGKPDEIGQLNRAAAQMGGQLKELIGNIQTISVQVENSAKEFQDMSIQMSRLGEATAQDILNIATGEEKQSQETGQIAISLQEMAIGIERITETSTIVADASSEMVARTQDGNQEAQNAAENMYNIESVSEQASQSMKLVAERSNEIAAMVGSIRKIADQTNILALNAGIEAAHAGDQGKSFAVVAGEVKKLALESTHLAEQVTVLIEQMKGATDVALQVINQGLTEAEQGKASVSAVNQTLRQILNHARKVADQIQEVSASSEQMTATSGEVAEKVKEIAQTAKLSFEHTQNVMAASQEQVASMEEAASSSESLLSMAQSLSDSVRKFKI